MTECKQQLNTIIESKNHTIANINEIKNKIGRPVDKYYDLTINYVEQCAEIISKIDAHQSSEKYFSQFKSFYERTSIDISDLISAAINNSFTPEIIEKMFEDSNAKILELKSIIRFSNIIGDFSKNVVAIGANGSGKSTLAEK